MVKDHVCLASKQAAFIKNENAVLGLPMRLTVSIIIGTVALIAILSFILNPCLFPGKMIVSVDSMVNEIPVDDASATFDFTVSVSEVDGHPIGNANVIIKGLGGIGSGSTDENGETTIQITVELEEGQYEGYLDVSVKAPCHETFSQNDMIKIVRGS
jgi:hypothetical protein